MKILLLVTLMLLLLPANTLANTVGLTPSRLYLDNLLPGSYLEKDIFLQNPSKDNLTVTLIKKGQAADWVTLSIPNKVNLDDSQDIIPIKTYIQIPDDASYEKHNGTITFIFSKEQKEGLSASAGLTLYLRFDVQKEIYTKQRIISYGFNNPLANNISFNFEFENKGNIPDAPTNISFRVKQNEKLLHTYTQEILEKTDPFSKKTYSVQTPFYLKPGSYWVDVILNKNKTMMFNENILLKIEERHSPNSLTKQTPYSRNSLFLLSIRENWGGLMIYYFIPIKLG